LRQKANGVSSQIDVEWAVPTKRMSAATLKRKLKDETATNVLALGHRMPYQRTRIAGMNAYVWQGVSGSHGILGRYGAGEYSRETWVQSDKMSVTILCEGGHNEDIAAFSARCAQLTSSLKVY
jgi:hypothetical protein